MKTKEFIKELNKKDLKQLNASLISNRDKLHELRRDLTLGKVKNMGEISTVRRQIAQIMTIINIKAASLIDEPTKESSDDKD